MEDATVLDLDLLGVIPTLSPRKIELTTNEQMNNMSNMSFLQLNYLKICRIIYEILIPPSPNSSICVKRGSS